MKRILLAAVLILGVSAPAHAQLIVNDTSNFVKLKEIVKTLYEKYTVIRKQYDRVMLLSARLENMGRYRTKTAGSVIHDTLTYGYAAPLLAGLNSGDPRGALYETTTTRIPGADDLRTLPVSAAQRAELERAMGGVQIRDSLMQRGIHTVGANRVFSRDLDRATQDLEDDVTRPANKEHYLNANMDKLSAAELLGRRYDTQFNQLLSAAVEHQIGRSKQDRDSEAEWMNAQWMAASKGQEKNAAMQAGSTEALKGWRLP